MTEGNQMIAAVDASNIREAAAVHAASWQASHRAFCAPDFVALHTPERQREYIRRKMDGGSRSFLLIADMPVGVVSVTGSLIEDLYILPERQNRGYGTALLRFAIGRCAGVPTLWILENNAGAERLYRRLGFTETGRRNAITGELDEIEFVLHKEAYPMDHEQKARDLFMQGYNCAQAVACAFDDVTGLDRDTLARMASSFGGGMGRLREVCGAVSGALLALGLALGYDVPGDQEIKKAHYRLVQEFARRFREKNGTIICRELLRDVPVTPGGEPEARTPEFYARRPCLRLVGEAAAILDDILTEQKKKEEHP